VREEEVVALAGEGEVLKEGLPVVREDVDEAGAPVVDVEPPAALQGFQRGLKAAFGHHGVGRE
jgi:hypothetical protein